MNTLTSTTSEAIVLSPSTPIPRMKTTSKSTRLRLSPSVAAIAAAVFFAASPSLFAQLVWQGGTGNWTDPAADNWGVGVGAYPGDTTYPTNGALIGDGSVVNVTTPITMGTNTTAATGSLSLSNATLNVSSDFTNRGALYTGNWKSSTVNVLSGTFTQNQRFDLGAAGGNLTSSLVTTLALSNSAIFNMTNSNFRFGYTSGGANRAYLTVTDNAVFSANSMSTNWSQGTVRVSGSGDFNVTNNAVMGAAAAIEVSGNGTVDIGGSLTTDGDIKFTLNGSGFVNDITVGGLLTVKETTKLTIDATALLAGNYGTIVLFDYGTLSTTNTFSSITVQNALGATYTYNNAYDMGGGNFGIALTDFTVIPEPSTAAYLIGGIGALLLLRLRRRVN